MSPDSGMALAILIAMILIVSIPGVVLGAIGYFVGKARTDDAESKRKGGLAFGCGGFVLGAALGVLGVVFTFYEDTFEPTMALQTPPGFAHDSVIILEDPTASLRLDWNTTRSEATLPTPATGVVRLGDLEEFSGRGFFATLPSGDTTVGFSSQPAPPGLRPAIVVLCLSFAHHTDCDREDIEELIREREGR